MKHHDSTSPVLALPIALVVALALACGGRDAVSPAVAPEPAEVRVAQASLATLREWRELPATVEPTRVVRLASPAEGPVTRLLVREGDEVVTGALLLVIGRREAARTSLDAAREGLREAEVDHARIEHLVGTGAIPGERLDQSSAALEGARATVAAAEQATGDFDIRAPWPGVVSGILVDEGNYVAPRTPLVELFDPESLVLRSHLPEAASLGVARGVEVSVRFDALPDREEKTQVVRVFPELDRQLRTRTIELALPLELDAIPGMFARIRIPLGHRWRALEGEVWAKTAFGSALVAVGSAPAAGEPRIGTHLDERRLLTEACAALRGANAPSSAPAERAARGQGVGLATGRAASLPSSW